MKVMDYTIKHKLQVNPDECEGFVLLGSFEAFKDERQKIREIMFETYGIKNIYFAPQATMAVYSTGLTTGLSITSGEYLT